MNINDVETIIREWIILSSQLDSSQVIYEHQNAPKAQQDFITLNTKSIRNIGIKDLTNNTNGTITTTQGKQADLSINCYGKNARNIMINVLDSLQKYEIKESFAVSEISVNTDSELRNLTFIETNQWIDRRQLDISVMFGNSITEDMGYFDEIGIISNDLSPDFIPENYRVIDGSLELESIEEVRNYDTLDSEIKLLQEMYEQYNGELITSEIVIDDNSEIVNYRIAESKTQFDINQDIDNFDIIDSDISIDDDSEVENYKIFDSEINLESFIIQDINKTIDLNIDIETSIDNVNQAIPYIILPPEIIYISNITSTSFVVEWINQDNITEVLIELSDDNFETILSQNVLNLESYTFEDLLPNTQYKLRIKSLSNNGDSEYSEIENITTESVLFDFVTDSNTLLYWRGQEGTGTAINDETVNAKDATLNGTTAGVWQSGLLTGDTASMRLNGTNNYIQTDTLDNTAFVDFTIRCAFKFETGDKAYQSHTLFPSKGEFDGSAGDSTNQSFLLFRADNFVYFYIFDTTHAAFSQKAVIAKISYSFTETTKYTIQASFKLQNPLNSNLNLVEICVNGIKQTVTFESTISNVSAVKQVNRHILVGKFTPFSHFSRVTLIRPAVIDTVFRTEAQSLTDYSTLIL